MDAWRKVWREGASHFISDEGLAALLKALKSDDPSLIQGASTNPPPLACVQDWPLEGACLLTLPAWLGDGMASVGEAEEFFAKVCFETDQLLGEPAACRWLLNWYDETPREEMRRLLLEEVERTLNRRVEGVESCKPVGKV